MPDETIRLNISWNERIERVAAARSAAACESRSAYLARLVRDDLERSGGNLNDRRWDPPKEKTK
jgi:hypothetical protein